MSLESYFVLFIAMFVVSVIPGPAVIAITSISISGGFRRGAAMTLGLVLADCVFIILSVTGLSYIAGIMGGTFIIIKYLCAAYLIWMGLLLIMSNSVQQGTLSKTYNKNVDVLAGFLLTLSNPKAIVFYIALFPTFVDFETITIYEVLGIICTAILAFGSVNLGFAYVSSKARKFVSISGRFDIVRKVAGSFLVLSGVGVAARA